MSIACVCWDKEYSNPLSKKKNQTNALQRKETRMQRVKGIAPDPSQGWDLVNAMIQLRNVVSVFVVRFP